jgi:hypothetical protein
VRSFWESWKKGRAVFAPPGMITMQLHLSLDVTVLELKTLRSHEKSDFHL